MNCRNFLRSGVAFALATLLHLAPAQAEVQLPNIFGNSMVLQQGQENKVWGRAAAGEQVVVSIDDQKHTATADATGNWHVMLAPLQVGEPRTLSIEGKGNKVEFSDVLVGEVWVCSGQSNMQWSVNASSDAELERLSANFPQIRMINFPQIGSQEAIWSHDRQWQVCSPTTVGNFSAVGYFFARQLHRTLGVPVGMINNAWGGSACEAWINRETLSKDGRFDGLMQRWTAMEERFASLNGKTELSDQEKKERDGLNNQMRGNARPGNIYNGVLKSHLGYGIKGAIWYQGESNASRAYQYRDLFPLMIDSWRKEWNQGDFPFYWVQLADFMAEKGEPGDSAWAELREAQTMTMDRLPNTGEAVIIDIGEGKDIHPRNKLDVGRRLARWALAKDNGIDIRHQSPRYQSMEKEGNKIVLTFAHVDAWRPFDVNEPRGFAIAGEDKKFVWAQAKIRDDGRVEVWSDAVADPQSVRYAWADNPVCNMFTVSDLPLTPFRTDDWDGVTKNNQ